MIHGGSHSGSCYQLTADGRPGWAYIFAARGYPVVTLDWPGMGRSGAVDEVAITFDAICESFSNALAQIGGRFVLLTHSMGGAIGWRLAELSTDRVDAVVGIAPGPPGNMQPVPRVLSRTAEGIEVETPHRRFRIGSRPRSQNDPAFIHDKIIGTSRHFPRENVATYAASLHETPTALLTQRVNIDGAQVKVADPRKLAGKPILVVTGTDDLEHPRLDDGAIVDWLNANGAKAEFLWLGDHGISGNGHMMMLEKNSDAIADRILTWLDAQRFPSPPG
jgi:pimeloyl-ACP methyl ester carboxylesterase